LMSSGSEREKAFVSSFGTVGYVLLYIPADACFRFAVTAAAEGRRQRRSSGNASAFASASALAGMRALLDASEMCDVEVRAADGATVPAHGAMLAAASDAWKTRLSADWTSSSSTKRVVVDCAECADATAARDLVGLAYGQPPPATWARAAGVLAATCMWLPAKRAAVESVLVSQLPSSGESPVSVYSTAAALDLPALRRAAQARLLAQWTAMPETRDALNEELARAPELRAAIVDAACSAATAAAAADATARMRAIVSLPITGGSGGGFIDDEDDEEFGSESDSESEPVWESDSDFVEH